ncbi:MAG: hypothetical protein NWR30_13420 [Salibacteraceae bacterium]|jgi:hypothetical protein|nr:hypothetical protein [Salibacteraceae bacterium]
MKRHLLSSFILFISFNLLGQEDSSDTVFIQKDSLLGAAQSVFYERNRESKFYDRISYFGFGKFDERSYDYSKEYLIEKKWTLSKQTPLITWVNWVKLVQYEGAFYAYHPCDFNAHFKASINDSTYIDWTGEGPIANKILEQTKIDNQTYQFQTAGIYENNRTLVIHIIDSKRGIAIFEESSSEKEKHYYPMIAADLIKSVPLIVNNCETRKQAELRFEEPNYQEQLELK